MFKRRARNQQHTSTMSLLDVQKSLVSVIIPTYNRPNYLKQAIASAVAQTYKNIEIIVSDDCSPENPQEMIESFCDPRIKFRRNAKNLGIAINVIEAFKLAQGEYVTSLNDDDIWNEDFLEKLVPPLEANPDLVLSFSDHYIIDSDGNIDDAATEENTKRWKRNLLSEGVYQPFHEIGIVHQAVPSAVATVIRRDAIEWKDFQIPMGPFWDLYLTYLACRNGGGAYYFPERLSKYREHSQSETTISGKLNAGAKIRKSKASIFCYREFMEDERLKQFKSYFREQWLHAHTTLAIGLLRSENVSEARAYLFHALKQQKFNLRTIAALILSFTPKPLARKLLAI
jgi:glycosyltransferase involved in cell wall biosynthesis